VSRSKPETDRQALIVAALEALGRHVVRIQCGRVKVRGGWMHLAPTGTPDLYVLGWGWLETKMDKTKPSPDQLAMHDRIRRAGELVAVVRTPAEAIRAVSSGRIREGQAS
jgi:hypothetical protein